MRDPVSAHCSNRIALTAFVLGGAVAACSSSTSSGPATPCGDVAVDRFKELTIVDDGIVTDQRASNAADGAWSFRYVIENMAPQGTDPGQFVASWFDEWWTVEQINNYPVNEPSTTRNQMDAQILCPWAERTASNNCTANCQDQVDDSWKDSCTVNPPVLDLAVAPFKLLAIVNRMDLRGQPDISKYGEARLVFGLTSGASDDPNASMMPMTLIFEFDLPTTAGSAKDWAAQWHALGSIPNYDETFRSKLQGITDSFVKRGGNPSAPNGSWLGQARTNESVTNWVWQLREFTLGTDGQMHSHTVRNTPAQALNSSPQLAQFINDNADGLAKNQVLIPDNMLAGSANQLEYVWGFGGMDQATLNAFSVSTCNGCHSMRQPSVSVDTVFHISPFQHGTAKVSVFLNNPQDQAHDELAHRTTNLQSALCGQ